MRGSPKFVLTATLALAVHVVWSMCHSSSAADEQRQLDELISSLKAKGEPILPSDFVGKGVAPEENAGPAIRVASRRVDFKSKAWMDYDTLDGVRVPPTPRQAAIFRALVESEKETLEMLDAALAKKEVDWQIQMKSPVISMLLPQLKDARPAASLLRVAAFDAFARRDYRAAVERLRQLLVLSKMTDRQPALVSHLDSMGMAAIVYNVVFSMTPQLQIETAGKLDAKAATAEQMRLLIAELLDDSEMREAMTMALKFERMAQLDTVTMLAAGKLKWKDLAPAGGPPEPADFEAALADAKPMAEHMGLMIEAMKSADYPTCVKTMPKDLPNILKQQNGDHAMAMLLLPSLDRAGLTHFRSLTERKLAAAALAVRWAAVDAGGKFPARLEDLKPKYLPTVPMDPMGGTGRALHYKLDGGRAVIYSVGQDGVDNGGSEKAPADNKRGRWGAEDLVVEVGR